MKRNDILWKGILENTFGDFLKFFFQEAEMIFSLDKDFQFLDKELEQLFPTEEIESPKFVDKLVKVFSSSGREEWILIHIEIQGYQDKNFARRMFTYFYRILDKYDKPITAIAIFTDNNRKFRPEAYEYNYLGTKNTFQFNTYKVLEQDEQTLIKDDNPFSIVILTVLLALKKSYLNDEKLLNLKYSLAKNLLKKKIEKHKIDALLIFLQRYITFADSNYNSKFDRKIEELAENQRTMGIREQVLEIAKKEGLKEGLEKGISKGTAKGKVEGIEEGKAEVVKNLIISNRFTATEIANFASVTETFVLQIKERL